MLHIGMKAEGFKQRVRTGFLILCTGFALGARAAEAPNVLLIYTDDHGYADLGAQQVDEDIRTPHLDQLARDGVRFTRGYVTAPQCVPSRAGVITGRHQNRFGVEDNNKGPLPHDVLTLPERLKRAGYVTGMVGKWHLDHIAENRGQGRAAGNSRDYLPHRHGFDEYWCGPMRQYHASHDLQGKPLADAPAVVSDPRFRITVQTEAALSFLQRRGGRREQPWFLYLAWFAPHVPLESPEPWFSRTPARLPLERRQALAMIAAMDDGLGRIRQKLEQLGLSDRTLIFFIGDNGAPLKEGAWDGSLNLPLVGEKGMLTDGGVRVPFLAAWPKHLPAGRVYEQPVSSLDVAATAVALAGLPHDDQLDGVNLLPFLTGKQEGRPHDALYWRWRSQAAVLEFPWKLIRLGTNAAYLFDTTKPEGESRNLFSQQTEVATRLGRKLDQWCATLQPPGPAVEWNAQDDLFFAAHVEKRIDHVTKKGPGRGQQEPAAGAVASVTGWVCRNGSLVSKDGMVQVTSGRNSSGPFLAKASLGLPGPLAATVELKTSESGQAAIAWRKAGETDFLPANISRARLEDSRDWQKCDIRIPADGKIIHLRVHLPAGTTLVRSIAIKDAEGKSTELLGAAHP